MGKLGELLGRMLFLFRLKEFDEEISEEMRFHVEMMTRENRAAGMSESQARREALSRFGN